MDICNRGAGTTTQTGSPQRECPFQTLHLLVAGHLMRVCNGANLVNEVSLMLA